TDAPAAALRQIDRVLYLGISRRQPVVCHLQTWIHVWPSARLDRLDLPNNGILILCLCQVDYWMSRVVERDNPDRIALAQEADGGGRRFVGESHLLSGHRA